MEKSCSPDAMAAESQQRAYHFSLITRGIRALMLAGVNLQTVLGDRAQRLGKSGFACARPEFQGAAVCSLAPFCRAQSQPYQAIAALCTVRCASSVVPGAKSDICCLCACRGQILQRGRHPVTVCKPARARRPCPLEDYP